MPIPRMTVLTKLPEMLADRSYGERRHRQFVRKSLDVVLEHHAQQRMPKHFTTWGAQEYGYRSRSVQYNRRKFRKFGHALPLVYTGATRNSVLKDFRLAGVGRGTGQITRALRFRIPIKGGSLRFRKRTVQSVRLLQMMGEISTVTAREIQKFGEELRDSYVTMVRAETKERKRVRRKVVGG